MGTTDPWRAAVRRRRRAQLAFAIALLVAAAWAIVIAVRDDDVPVDLSRPDARRAADVALGVVPGRVVGVARDRDNGKWEVTIAQGGQEYEVELAPRDLSLLRLDYD